MTYNEINNYPVLDLTKVSFNEKYYLPFRIHIISLALNYIRMRYIQYVHYVNEFQELLKSGAELQNLQISGTHS